MQRTTTRVTRIGGLAAMLLLLLGPGLAQAQTPTTTSPPAKGGQGFSIEPSGPNGPGGRDYFVYRLKPGEVFGDTVAVSNLGDQPVRFALYATDAVPGENAAFALLREEQQPKDVGSWINLATKDYTAQPHSRIDIPFSVTVPANATPGDHVGAVVAQPIGAGASSGNQVNLDVRLRIGARVYVRVAGDAKAALRVERLAFDYNQSLGPTSGHAHIEYVVRNTGNLVLHPTATLRVKGPFGITVDSFAARELPELLPGAKFTVAETARDLPLLVRLYADIDLNAEATKTNASTATWAIPWLAFALVVLVAGVVVWMRRTRPVPERVMATA